MKNSFYSNSSLKSPSSRTFQVDFESNPNAHTLFQVYVHFLKNRGTMNAYQFNKFCLDTQIIDQSIKKDSVDIIFLRQGREQDFAQFSISLKKLAHFLYPNAELSKTLKNIFENNIKQFFNYLIEKKFSNYLGILKGEAMNLLNFHDFLLVLYNKHVVDGNICLYTFLKLYEIFPLMINVNRLEDIIFFISSNEAEIDEIFSEHLTPSKLTNFIAALLFVALTVFENEKNPFQCLMQKIFYNCSALTPEATYFPLAETAVSEVFGRQYSEADEKNRVTLLNIYKYYTCYCDQISNIKMGGKSFFKFLKDTGLSAKNNKSFQTKAEIIFTKVSKNKKFMVFEDFFCFMNGLASKKSKEQEDEALGLFIEENLMGSYETAVERFENQRESVMALDDLFSEEAMKVFGDRIRPHLLKMFELIAPVSANSLLIFLNASNVIPEFTNTLTVFNLLPFFVDDFDEYLERGDDSYTLTFSQFEGLIYYLGLTSETTRGLNCNIKKVAC